MKTIKINLANPPKNIGHSQYKIDELVSDLVSAVKSRNDATTKCSLSLYPTPNYGLHCHNNTIYSYNVDNVILEYKKLIVPDIKQKRTLFGKFANRIRTIIQTKCATVPYMFEARQFEDDATRLTKINETLSYIEENAIKKAV